MHLFDQLQSHFTIPTAYTDWTEYRNTLTGYLITETNQVSLPLSFHANMEQTDILPTLAIVGAGACNDLDLSRLTPHFSRITLIDYNADSMQQALATYELTDNPQIECLPVSLNGITTNDYREFCEELQFFLRETSMHITPEHFESYAISLVTGYFEKSRQTAIPLAAASYDYIWCFGVHSQFQAMFSYIYHAFEVNLKHNVFNEQTNMSERFSNCLKAENSSFIPQFHDCLLSSAKKAVFLGLEQKRLENEEAVEGSHQAILDIRNRNLSLKENTVIWPFSPATNVSYEMLMQKITI